MEDKSSVSIDDLRVRERFQYQTSILCFKNIESDHHIENKVPIRIEVENISYSGLGIICSRNINPSSLLVFNINNGEEIREMMLEVKWVKKQKGAYQAGCEFVGLTKADIYFIHEIIRKLKRQPKEEK